jgi:hypothetical protein
VSSGRQPPLLIVVVDTEEEFDWDAPYSRQNTGVRAMRHIDRVQRIFDRFALKPTYVIDYPVASQADGCQPLLDVWQDGRCTIGAHIHPWVNPPYDEALSVRNSFVMNLPSSLQAAKMDVLIDTIGSSFGRPQVFKAGRYGMNHAMIPLLERLGILVDTSVCPRHDFSNQDGPSFAQYDSTPHWLTSQLLELPCTVDYTGWAGSLRPALHRGATRPAMERLYAPGICAKTRMVNRIMLSPEGNSCEEMIALTSALFRRGLRTFTLSFHSPSVEPGHTPYVRTEHDLSSFLSSIERFCDFFFGRLGGEAATPLAYRDSLLSQTKATA